MFEEIPPRIFQASDFRLYLVWSEQKPLQHCGVPGAEAAVPRPPWEPQAKPPTSRFSGIFTKRKPPHAAFPTPQPLSFLCLILPKVSPTSSSTPVGACAGPCPLPPTPAGAGGEGWGAGGCPRWRCFGCLLITRKKCSGTGQGPKNLIL